MRTAELGVVRVMVIVRALPNAAGAESQNSKDSHQARSQPGIGQDRLMLLIVINHKQPENEQPGEKTAENPAGPMKVPKSPRNGNRQEKRCGKKIPPAPRCGIHRVRFGCQYEFFSCSHIRLTSRFSQYSAKSIPLSSVGVGKLTYPVMVARMRSLSTINSASVGA